MKKDVLTYAAGKTVPALVNLVIIVVAVRLLGEAEYGKYSLVFYAAMLICTMASGWIQQSILRFYSAYPGEQATIINRFFLLTLLSSFLAVAAGILFCLFYFRITWSESLVVAVFIFLYNFFLFHLSLNQAQKRPGQYALIESSFNLLYIGLLTGFIYLLDQRQFLVMFMAMAIGLIMTEAIRIFILPKGRVGIDYGKVYFTKGFTKTVFRFGFPITLWLFLSYLVNISDRFLIKEFGSYDEVGVYSAVKDLIIKISTFTTVPILLAYHPVIVENWNREQKREAIRLVKEGIIYCMIISLAVLTGFLLFKEMIFSKVLHLQLSHPVLVSVTLVLSAFLWQMAMLFHKPLELLFRPGLMLCAIVAALVVNVVGNILLVPGFGYPASAVVSLISVLTYILVTFAFLVYFNSKNAFR